MSTATETSPAAPAPSFQDDMKQVWKAAGVIAFGLSVISLGIPVLVAKLTKELGPALEIWQTLAATAPLTASVALIGTGLLRGWIDDCPKLVFGAAGTLLLTAWIGHLVGLAGWIDLGQLWEKQSTGPIQFVVILVGAFLGNYWSIYGPQNFCASLLVGGFLAWAWGMKILPHLERGAAER